MPNDFNRAIIDEFRANAGQVGGPFADARLLLLTTTGARSGRPHTTPLGYLHAGGRLLVIASAAGAQYHPAWYHNLLVNPHVTVETGVFTFSADAAVLAREDRDRAFARAVEANPGWSDYQAKTSRVIPIVALTPVDGGPAADSWSTALRLIHGAFRRELALIRKEVAESGPGIGAQLRIDCLTVCQGLHHHHAGEDAQMFPLVGERHPEFADALTRLRGEHQEIARLLDDLQRLISSDRADPGRLLTDIERVAGELEAHLDYEEQQLLPILDGLVA